MAGELVSVAYVNSSGEDIPPYGIFQLDGECVQTDTGDYVLQAVAPGDGAGPYFIDDGKGTSASGAGIYGNGFRAAEGPVWVLYGCTDPPSPWQKVGPVIGQFFVSTLGDGYWYAGQYDSDNNMVLVMADALVQVATKCVTSSSSSSSPSSSSKGSVSGSGSSSSGCGCVTVVTNVSCGSGGLSVTFGSARGCC